MFSKRNKTAGTLDSYFQLKHNIKMILPVVCTSIIYYLFYLLIQDNDRPKIIIHFITFTYNSILLPMHLAYFNIIRFSHTKKELLT